MPRITTDFPSISIPIPDIRIPGIEIRIGSPDSRSEATLINALRAQSFDSGRLRVLSQRLEDRAKVAPRHWPSVLQTFTFDNGRLDAVQMLVNHRGSGLDFNDEQPVLNTFTFDSSRQRAAQIL